MQTKFLEELGLTQGEIKAYLALLKLGSSSTGPIAKESCVSRSKLYEILDKLEKKGMVSHIEKNGVIYFQSVEPRKIKDYIKEKEENLKKLRKDFEKFLPNLEKLTKGKKTQNVRVYQGTKGLITCYEHYLLKLKKGESMYAIGTSKFQPELHHLYWQKDHLRRDKKGIKIFMLFNKDTPRETLRDRNSYKLCYARYMPTDVQTPTYFIIFADTTMIVIPGKNTITIEIINKNIADSFKAYFQAFWKKAKKFK